MYNFLIGTGITVLIVALLYAVFLMVVAFVSVRPPRIPTFLSPGVLGERDEVVEIVTEDSVTLRGWWVEGTVNTVVVCFHGFLANRCEWVPYAPRLRASGPSLLFVDHRCHGGSARGKCTFGIDEVKDVRAAVEYARDRLRGCKVVLLGSSMGGTAAARAVATDPKLADGLILDGPYANLAEAAKGFWYVTGFKSVAVLMAPAGSFGRLWLGFDPKKVDMLGTYAGLREVPTLFLYGTADTVVPKGSAAKCVEASGGQVEWFEGSGHAQGRFAEPDRYYSSIDRFLRDGGFLDGPILNQERERSTTFSGTNAV